METKGSEQPRCSVVKASNSSSVGAESGALSPREGLPDPELAAVVAAWPTLPAAIKAGILAMAGAAK